MAMAALMGAPACGAADEPSEAGIDPDEAEDAAVAPRTFVVDLDRATTAENAIATILEAGRPELAGACADLPAATIRIFSPFDPGVFADVPCSFAFYGGAAAEGTSPAPASDGGEPIDTDQQALSPFSLGCAVFVLGSSFVASRAICPRARNQRDFKRCQNWSDAGFAGISIMCAFF
ncbi:hypothetical protein WME98_17070 [Sorangium sp. So ce296]|uniref:hypothetical protein n=1 Tax=Sorangium sp. So ce296 TaxID=3133296 RepID=UPI003F646266